MVSIGCLGEATYGELTVGARLFAMHGRKIRHGQQTIARVHRTLKVAHPRTTLIEVDRLLDVTHIAHRLSEVEDRSGVIGIAFEILPEETRIARELVSA